MEKTISYATKGTCSRKIDVTLDGDVIKDVRFYGGCSGNTQGVSILVKGMKARDAISRLEGVKCGMKSTSCPDQLSKALKIALEEEESK